MRLEELGYVSCLGHYDHCCKKRYPFYPHVCLASDSYPGSIGLRCQRPKQLDSSSSNEVAYQSVLNHGQKVWYCFLMIYYKKGMKTISITMTECVGPLCSRKGIRISTSGTMESTNAAGMLKLILESFADPAPRIYPRARCPTAKRLLFLRFKQERCFI